MAVDGNEKGDLQVNTFENNETFADKQVLINNARQDETNTETHKVINKTNAENNSQQNDHSNTTKHETEQNNNLGKQSDGDVKNNPNANETSEQDTPNKETNEDNRQSTLDFLNEHLKNVYKETYPEANGEEKKEEKKTSRRSSHYLQNIQMTNSSLGLTLAGSEKKDTILLPESRTVTRFSPIWKQTLASSAPILLTIVSGLTSGYSAILLPQLKATPGPIPSDEDTTSWIAAMAALPMAPGCLVSGWMMEKFGRKTSHYITCIPLFLGWILIASSSNLGLMLIGRFLTGLCAGLCGPLVPVYIGETTEPKYRGLFLAAVSLAIALGILVAHIIGTFLSWQWTATICAVFPVLTFGLLSFTPESPVWLISQGRIEDGVKAF